MRVCGLAYGERAAKSPPLPIRRARESAGRAEECKFSLIFIPVEAPESWICRIIRQPRPVQQQDVGAVYFEDGVPFPFISRMKSLRFSPPKTLIPFVRSRVRHLPQEALPVRQRRQLKEK